MWSLQDLLFILCIPLSSVTGATDVIHVTGYERREVHVSCPYDQGYKSNKKYLCRNECGNDDEIVIKTTEVKKGRYSIHDDKNKHIFTVTISDLDQKDAGKYLCMVDRFGRDPSTAEVQLDNRIADVHMLVYILPATLLAVLVVLTVALVMLYKYKCYKVQGSEVSMNSNTTTPAEEVEVQYVDHIYDNHVLDKTGGDDM